MTTATNNESATAAVMPSAAAATLRKKSSVVRLTKAWYVVCTSAELGHKPLARTLYGQPLVVFRGQDGKAGVLLDRCAHRNVPLSDGRVAGCRLQCPYHGWQFDRAGDCKRIPGLLAAAELPRRAVPSYATREQDGYVWVYATADVEPEGEPYRLPLLGKAGYLTVRHVVAAKASLHAIIENALDVPHTAFLHKGLFRGTGKTNIITAIVTRDDNSVTTEYRGEPRPAGLAGRLLSPSGGVVTHFDRFILPSIAEVEYAIGEENHILVSALCTPLDDFHTRLYAAVSLRTRVPGFLVKPLVEPVALRIFGQDAAILKKQTDTIFRFGGERYASTELDLMGPQILRLMRRAQKGQAAKDDDHNWRREVKLEV